MMAPEGGSVANQGQQDRPTSVPISTHALEHRPSAGSTMSPDDSGYLSIGTDDIIEEEDSQATPKGRPSPSQPESLTPQTRQRMFEGFFVFNPNEEQLRRYNEVLSYITPSFNDAIQKGAGLFSSRKSKPKRVHGVRLVVMGADALEANATPHIVFFCSRDVGESIRALLEQPAWKRILRPDDASVLSFSYRIVLRGITLKFFTSEFSTEIPEGDDPTSRSSKLTHCGTPIRLNNGNSVEWRRATLGGTLEVTNHLGWVESYAMTAGHQLDGWSDEEPEQPEDDEINTKESEKTAWNFKECKRYGNVVTAGTSAETYPGVKKYFDWAVFKFEWRRLNAVVTDNTVEVSSLIQLPDPGASPPVSGKVWIISASVGIITGLVQPGMAQIAIDPGEEVIGTYLVSISGDCSIADGDSGSWVVSHDKNQLLGHVVASDVLGDVYVVPISATLDDIQFRLRASSISLPMQDGYGTTLAALPSEVKTICVEANNLYERAAKSISICHDTLVEIVSFKTALKHLFSEVRDPDSPANGSHEMKRTKAYKRQLWTTLGECSQAIKDTGKMIDQCRNLRYTPNIPQGDILTSRLRIEAKIRRKLSTLTIKIGTFLDKIQLHDTGSARPTNNPKQRLLDTVISKFDWVLLCVWDHGLGQRLEGIEENMIGKERVLLEFRKGLIEEGFPESVLDRNKGLFRAYIRELESVGWLDRETPPFLRDLLLQKKPPALPQKLMSLVSPPSHVLYDFKQPATYIPNPAFSTPDEPSGYTAFITTQQLIDIDASPLELLSLRRTGVITKVAPHGQGNEIPLDAIWTKISRRIVSPEILERVGVRYEARPDFLAVLGMLSKDTIIQWARLSSKDPWESDLQAWDSDLETWGLREPDSSDESDTREDDDNVSIPAKNQDLTTAKNTDVDSKPFRSRFTSQTTGIKGIPATYMASESGRNTESYKDGKGYEKGHFAGDGAKGKETVAEDGHKPEPDKSGRVAQKKIAIRELLDAVGIGGAAASLLRVLAESADGS